MHKQFFFHGNLRVTSQMNVERLANEDCFYLRRLSPGQVMVKFFLVVLKEDPHRIEGLYFWTK